MLKKLFGLAPQKTEDGSYNPSPFSLKVATSSVTDYKPLDYGVSKGEKQGKILVVCTEEANVPMKNGKYFSSGNHPVETLVPMLHLKQAGFDFDIYTPHGKAVKFEMWAMPTKDEHVMGIYKDYLSQFEQPKNLSEFIANRFADKDEYAAIYFPGGHGALMGLPEDENVGKLIHWAKKEDLYHLSICHGPATLLAASPTDGTSFIYEGYEIAAFPDKVDKQTPMIGYMPGQLTWFFGEKLQSLGVKIINKKADTTCHTDRKLITGASPNAANKFGELCAREMLKGRK